MYEISYYFTPEEKICLTGSEDNLLIIRYMYLKEDKWRECSSIPPLTKEKALIINKLINRWYIEYTNF